MNWETYVQILIATLILFTAGYYIIRYLDGNYTYKDEIYSEKITRVIKSDDFGGRKEYNIKIIIIKRTYLSGKIQFISKELKV